MVSSSSTTSTRIWLIYSFALIFKLPERRLEGIFRWVWSSVPACGNYFTLCR